MLKVLSEKEIRFFLVKWVFFWATVMCFYSLVLRQFGVDHLNKFYITVPYFLCAASVWGLYVFFKKLKNIQSNFNKQLVGILLLAVSFISLCIQVDRHFPISSEIELFLFEKRFFFQLFKIESISSKVADIIFQQTLIISLVLFMKEKLKNDNEVIKNFMFVFFVLHIPLFVIFKMYSLVFTLPSLFGGFLFPWSILKCKYGLVVSFGIHFSYYVLLGLVSRTFLVYL